MTREGPAPISEVSVGDEVWSFDTASGAWAWRPVSETFVHPHEGPVIQLGIGDEVLEATPNHPVCVASGHALAARAVPRDIGDDPLECGHGGRWVEVGDVLVGDTVVRADGPSTVASVTAHEASQPVYNISVEGSHTYAVSAEGVLVDNKAARRVPPPERFTKEMHSRSRVIAEGKNIRKIDEITEKFGGKRWEWKKKFTIINTSPGGASVLSGTGTLIHFEVHMRVCVQSQGQVSEPLPPYLTPGREYLVVGVNWQSFRIMDDCNEPILYPKELFEILDNSIPSDWVRRDYEDDEYHIDPPEVAFPGFYEDYFDHKDEARTTFEQVLARLEKTCGPRWS